MPGNLGIKCNDQYFVNMPYSYNPKEIELTKVLSLIKLHGSITWHLMKKGEAQEHRHFQLVNWDESKDAKLTDYSIYECGELETMTIEGIGPIPKACFMMLPDMFKGLGFAGEGWEEIDAFFRSLYNVTADRIKDADQVIIVGFSCRSTDYLASMLLSINLRGKSADQVLVIDPAEKVPEGISKNIKEFTYIQKTFHQWIKEGGLEELDKKASPSP